MPVVVPVPVSCCSVRVLVAMLSIERIQRVCHSGQCRWYKATHNNTTSTTQQQHNNNTTTTQHKQDTTQHNATQEQHNTTRTTETTKQHVMRGEGSDVLFVLVHILVRCCWMCIVPCHVMLCRVMSYYVVSCRCVLRAFHVVRCLLYVQVVMCLMVVIVPSPTSGLPIRSSASQDGVTSYPNNSTAPHHSKHKPSQQQQQQQHQQQQQRNRSTASIHQSEPSASRSIAPSGSRVMFRPMHMCAPSRVCRSHRIWPTPRRCLPSPRSPLVQMTLLPQSRPPATHNRHVVSHMTRSSPRSP